MANDINVITVAGRVGRDPELRTTASGDSVLSFSLANNQYSKGAGDDNTLTTWYNVSFFGKRAEALGRFLTKGAQVVVSGAHQMRPYTGKNGDALSCDIRASDVQVVGNKGDGGASAAQSRPASSGRNRPQAIELDEDVPF
jgi:single-strand DNA-binding protein